MNTLTGGGVEAPLLALGLSADDIEVLSRQGFVATEFRGHRGPFYKLRWRDGDRQRVLYLGQDGACVEQIRTALAALQYPRRASRELDILLRIARKTLRAVKQSVEIGAVEDGFHYHGYARRRTRSRNLLERNGNSEKGSSQRPEVKP